MLLHLIGLGTTIAPEFTVLNELADLYEQLGQAVPAKYLLYGRDAHRTPAGIHTDGLGKVLADGWCPIRRSQPSGPATGASPDSGQQPGWTYFPDQESHRTGTGQRELGKGHPGLHALHMALQEEFEAGRQTAVDWEEIAERALKLQRHRAVVASGP